MLEFRIWFSQMLLNFVLAQLFVVHVVAHCDSIIDKLVEMGFENLKKGEKEKEWMDL